MRRIGTIAIRLASGLALFCLAAPVPASPRLAAVPSATPAALRPGYLDLGEGALAFVPAGLPAGRPPPLLVLMHGAGGDAAGFVRRFEREAQAHGIVLLGVKSRAPTWDLIASRAPREVRASRIDRRSVAFRADPPRIDAALRALFARIAVDQRRIGLAGFSDGASYALSIGTANPQLFSSVLAFSPGMAEVPRSPHREQRVFVSHGSEDPILSFSHASRAIVSRLEQRRLPVTFRPFRGGHVIPDDVAAEAVVFFLGDRRPA